MKCTALRALAYVGCRRLFISGVKGVASFLPLLLLCALLALLEQCIKLQVRYTVWRYGWCLRLHKQALMNFEAV